MLTRGGNSPRLRQFQSGSNLPNRGLYSMRTIVRLALCCCVLAAGAEGQRGGGGSRGGGGMGGGGVRGGGGMSGGGYRGGSVNTFHGGGFSGGSFRGGYNNGRGYGNVGFHSGYGRFY